MDNRDRERRHPRSLFWPIVLIGLGIVFLLNNLGVIQGDVWDFILRLWPVILIAIGLDSILNRSGLVGAVLMIGLGVVFLLGNFGYLAIDVWEMVFSLWPILLIAIGFDLVFGRRSVWASLVGLVIVLAILAAAIWVMGVGLPQGQPLTGQQISQPLEGAQTARITLEPGAADLTVDADAPQDLLVQGTVRLPQGFQARQDFSIEDEQARFRLVSTGSGIFIPGAGDFSWDLNLNPGILIDLRVNLGAGNAEIDLSNLQLSSMNMDLGVGRMVVVLPEDGNFNGQIDSAIGLLVIEVPRDAGIRISSDTGLANIQAPADFERTEDVFTTPEYAESQDRINLTVSQAIGNITIRYAEGN